MDFQSPEESVHEMNILKGLNFPTNTFDVVYSAQFIEHLTLEEGEKVLKNVAMVMKPGGIIRLVTPDLEELSKTYLTLLDELRLNPSKESKFKYDWIRLELFDQIVRDRSGGETLAFLAGSDEESRKYVIDRIGYTAKTLFANNNTKRRKPNIEEIFKKINRIPLRLKLVAMSMFATDAQRIGNFRRSGEVHRYIHDIYSLTLILNKAGFNSVERVNANKSSIKDWGKYELDIIGGVVDGPCSLYVEARRNES